MPRNMLITGAAGFIGANFVRYCLAEMPGVRLVLLDALTYAGNLANLDGVLGAEPIRFVHGSICDGDLVRSLMEQESIDTIVHFAAESHVDRSITGPDAFVETNVVGTHTLLKAARAAWLSGGASPPAAVRFHHISTDEVYGTLEPDDPPFREDTPYAPNSPYAASKAASDHLVRAYQHTFGLPTTTSNCSNNYGPYQFPEKLIPLAIINALSGAPIPVYGDGMQVRDWLFVEDHCRAIAQVLERGRVGETYNIGGGGTEVTNLKIVRVLCDLLDTAFRDDAGLAARFPDAPPARGGSTSELISFVRDRPGHDRRYAIDFAKAARELGYEPGETFTSGIARTVRWYIDNESWWRGVMDGSYREWVANQYGRTVAGPVARTE